MYHYSFAGRLNRNTNREEIIGTQGEGIPREDLQAMITDANQCPELLGSSPFKCHSKVIYF